MAEIMHLLIGPSSDDTATTVTNVAGGALFGAAVSGVTAYAGTVSHPAEDGYGEGDTNGLIVWGSEGFMSSIRRPDDWQAAATDLTQSTFSAENMPGDSRAAALYTAHLG